MNTQKFNNKVDELNIILSEARRATRELIEAVSNIAIENDNKRNAIRKQVFSKDCPEELELLYDKLSDNSRRASNKESWLIQKLFELDNMSQSLQKEIKDTEN